MNRREFLEYLGVLAAIPYLPQKPFTLFPAKSLTIADIVHVSFPSAKATILDGKTWATQELQDIHDAGRIQILSLGPIVKESSITKNNDVITKTYEVEEVVIPVVWSQKDDEMTPREKDKIKLVSQLFRNAFESMDDLLIEKIGNGKAIVSKEYRYDRGDIMSIPSTTSFVFKLYTAAAFM